jgi:hypothetical protein
MGLQIDDVCELCLYWRDKIVASEFRINPWHPGAGPGLELQKGEA